MAQKTYDLIEVHVTGGPWTADDAKAVEKQIIDALRRVLGFRASAYIADVRGEDDGS